MRMSGLRLQLRLIMDTNRLNSSEKLVMMIIAVNSTEQALCLRMNSELIGQCAGLSRSVVQRILCDLKEYGYLTVCEVEKKGKKFTQYAISDKICKDYEALKAQVSEHTKNYGSNYAYSD